MPPAADTTTFVVADESHVLDAEVVQKLQNGRNWAGTAARLLRVHPETFFELYSIL